MKPKCGKHHLISSTRIHWLSWILSVLSIILSIVAAVLVALVAIRADNKQEVAAIHSEEIKDMTCRDCLNENVGKLLSEPENGLNCCELKPGDLESAFEKLTRANNERDIEEYKDARNLTSVSAHVYLLGFDQDQHLNGLNQITVPLNRNGDNDNSHARGVRVENEGIEILISGVYYVYSSISYHKNTAKERSTYQTLYHFVNQTHQHHQPKSTPLLRSVFNRCPDCSDGKDSGYTGGIFHLSADDLIQVSISGQGVLGPNTIQGSSFLGLYMLANVQDTF
ncbi:hypothetical protein Btru_017436 [Bulinus truncatus]|nr:hypothetical protein Btru_017436 [Bulinus truncatus]